MNEEFYTLTAYIHNHSLISYAMEDYLEMIYRLLNNKINITITLLSSKLHIKKSSCSKMISKLKSLNLVKMNNNYIFLSSNGLYIGEFLYERHCILEEFFKNLNKNNFKLEQVEKIEHFIDSTTLQNINKLNKKSELF